MVAISLYRGNLHRVPGAPRQWPMPRRAISSRHFRELLRRRSQALAAAEGGEKEEEGEGRGKEEEERIGDSSVAKPEPSQPDRVENVEPQLAESKLEIKELKSMIKEEGEGEPLREPKRTDDASASNPPVAASAVVESTGGGAADVKLEMSNNLITVSDKEERKRELEKKLHVLNEKKHILVQMLKQILNAEEEMKRRNVQSSALRPSFPLQAETAVDVGSITRQTSRLSVEVNFSGDLGGELDSANQSTHMRQLLHIPSISPSAASLNRPVFQQNSVFHTPRASLAAVGQGQTSPNTFMGTSMASPSSFAPTGHQSLSVSLLPAPLPGHHYMASSPSPAASGGASSGFRDPRQTGS